MSNKTFYILFTVIVILMALVAPVLFLRALLFSVALAIVRSVVRRSDVRVIVLIIMTLLLIGLVILARS